MATSYNKAYDTLCVESNLSNRRVKYNSGGSLKGPQDGIDQCWDSKRN